jgi:hypothetical protein
MVETITKYEKMIPACKTEEEKVILMNMIATIKKQLLNLPKTTQSTDGNDSILPLELKNNNNDTSLVMKKKKIIDKWKFFDSCLREVFFFIAKQGHIVGKNATFDRVQHESQVLSLGEFFFFTKNFGLIDKNSLSKNVKEKMRHFFIKK